MDYNYNTPDEGYSRTETRVSAGRENAIHADASEQAMVTLQLYGNGRRWSLCVRRSKRVQSGKMNVGTQTENLDENRKSVATRQ